MSSDEDAKPPAKRVKAVTLNEICAEYEQRIEERMHIDSSDVIVTQKSRAMARWEKAFSKKYFYDEKVYSNVLEQLQDGKVPPIYHTLCREPVKRLFLPGTCVINVTGSDKPPSEDVIELSTEKVQAGLGTGISVEQIKKTIWSKRDFSYLSAFLTNDGQGFATVRDSYLKDDWNFNDEITNIVTVLVNTPAEMVGHDMEVTKVVSEFDVDSESGRNLITRSLSRGVVADCFEQSNPRKTYAIVGSPGIGKSWTLIYALQQALLYENACVQFCFQKEGLSWVCIRKNHHIYVWTMKNEKLKIEFGSDLFDNRNVLVLLDPKESTAGGASYNEGRRRLIFAASLNKKHFKSVDKVTPKYEKILNPYSLMELQVGLKYMAPFGCTFTDEEIASMLDRAKEVGNTPRYLLSSDASEIPKKRLMNFLTSSNRLSVKYLFGYQGLKFVEWNESLAGGVFALYAFGSISDENNGALPNDVGYDGDTNVDYSVRKILFTSDYVKREVAIAYRDDILNYDGYGSNAELAVMGELVEALFWSDMEKNIEMKSFKLSKDTDKETEESDCEIPFFFAEAEDIGFRPSIEELDESFFNTKKKCQMKKNCPLFDFAGPGYQVFQVTVSRGSHNMSYSGMKELLLASGILGKDENGVLCKSSHSISRKLNYYWVVPFGASHVWSKRKAENLSSGGKDKDKDIVTMCFNDCVDQFVVVMNKNLIQLTPPNLK